jgi:hypothetical protein
LCGTGASSDIATRRPGRARNVDAAFSVEGDDGPNGEGFVRTRLPRFRAGDVGEEVLEGGLIWSGEGLRCGAALNRLV